MPARPLLPKGAKDGFLVDGAACFFGVINRASADSFLALSIPDDTLLVLNSGGGDVASALDMAERILNLHLPVVVFHSCLSSCANYLFPSGATKVVLPDSYVAWHGGPAKVPPATLSPEHLAIYQRTLARQAAFFERVGVDDRMIYDPPPGSGITQENRSAKLWLWKANDLRDKFHVQDIRWMWFPKPKAPQTPSPKPE